MSGEIAVRVYYEDTDFSGNVYHAAYLKFFERARTEWLRDLGVSHSALAEKGLAFAVRHMEVDFLAPAHIDDLLTIRTEIAAMSGVRAEVLQTALRGDKVLCTARVTVVTITEKGRPTRLPEMMRAAK